MADFRVRALEIHSAYAWDFDWVRRALRFIQDHEMTALVLHRNDVVDRVVYPGKYFGGGDRKYSNIFERYRDIHRQLYKYTPTRRSGPYHRRDYANRIVELADRMGIEVWFENKELSFHEILLELNLRLTKNGTLCPSEPFWWEFLEVKYTELFEDIPGLAGIITAPATGESRLSISGNRCTCELCRTMTPQRWYSELILSMHRPIKRAGKELVIRDFVFDRRAQSELAEALERLPDDIIVSLKNTPHDYYPTFPNNPRLGQVGPHRQWVEFDCMAQYFGWGIGPAIMIDDLRYRMDVAKGFDVEGLIFRTDWESLDAHSAFHTPNLLNLYAGAALSIDRQTPGQDIYRRWLSEQGMLRPDADADAIDACAAWAERLFANSWPAVKRSLYTNDCVFSDSSIYPVSLNHAWWLAEEKNSLKDWDPSKADALATTEENVKRIMVEKDEAVRLVERMLAVLREERPAALTDAAYVDLERRVDVFHRYARGFRAIGRACILTKFLEDHGDAESPFVGEARALADRELRDLLDLSDEFRTYRESTDDRYTVYILLGWERLRVLHDDLSQRLRQAAPVVA